MSGILSYPRAAVASDPDFLEFRRAIGALRLGPLRNEAAGEGIDALRSMLAHGSLEPEEAVDLAVELRDLAYAAWLDNPSGVRVHWQAMVVCAEEWPKFNAPLATGFAPDIQAALAWYAAAAASGDRQGQRDASERLGSAAVLLAMSALMGRDISGELASAISIGGTNYRELRDAGAKLLYLESGAAYNTNLVLRVDLPGCAEPLVLVGEAKGGSAAFGTVRHAGQVIRQDDRRYAGSRADIMARAPGRGAVSQARRDAGRLIQQAILESRMVYLGARGWQLGGNFEMSGLFRHPP